MYSPPYNVEEIRLHYPDLAERPLADPVHHWRATTGIELIHEEPSLTEQERIWANWQEMSADMKEKSEDKSQELFGLNNSEHHRQIMRERYGVPKK